MGGTRRVNSHFCQEPLLLAGGLASIGRSRRRGRTLGDVDLLSPHHVHHGVVKVAHATHAGGGAVACTLGAGECALSVESTDK